MSENSVQACIYCKNWIHEDQSEFEILFMCDALLLFWE